MLIHEELESVIGAEATERLCKHFGGMRVYIPSWPTLEKERQKQNIIREVQNGENVYKVARRYGWSVNGIQRLVEKHAKNNK